MSKRFRLILSASFAVLALLACFAYGESVRAEAKIDRAEALERYGGELASIVVAARDLEPGEKVDSLTCEEREWVAELVPEGALTSLDDSLGLTLTSPVSAGTPLTETALREDSARLAIPEGTLAMAVALGDKIGVRDEVPLGTTLVGYRVVDGETRCISTHLTVIGIDDEGAGSASSITVAVPLEDVSAFIAAAGDGSLRLGQPADGLYAQGSDGQEEASSSEGETSPTAPVDVEPVEGELPPADEGILTEPIPSTPEEQL